MKPFVATELFLSARVLAKKRGLTQPPQHSTSIIMTYQKRHTEAERLAQDALDLAQQELAANYRPPDWHRLTPEQKRIFDVATAAHLAAERGNRAPLNQLRREGHF